MKTIDIQTYHMLRVGLLASSPDGDFIDNINPDFNLAVVSDDSDHLLIHNKLVGTLSYVNRQFSEVIDEVVAKLPNLVDKDLLAGLYISVFEQDADGILDVSEAYEDNIYEASETDDAGDYANSLFGLGSVSSNTGATAVICDGRVEYNGEVLDDASCFYGYTDEESTWVIGLTLAAD